MPVKRRPSWRAARPVVPEPVNGSSTVPPGLQPAAMQRNGRVIGNAAKCGPVYGRASSRGREGNSMASCGRLGLGPCQRG